MTTPAESKKKLEQALITYVEESGAQAGFAMFFNKDLSIKSVGSAVPGSFSKLLIEFLLTEALPKMLGGTASPPGFNEFVKKMKSVYPEEFAEIPSDDDPN